MHCEEALVDDASEREEIEALHKKIVDFLIVFVETLAPKIEEVGHLSALVVSSDEGHCGWMPDLQYVEKQQYFYGE